MNSKILHCCLDVIKQREKELHPELQPRRENAEEFVTLHDDTFDELPFR